jgi:hypothetical protein
VTYTETQTFTVTPTPHLPLSLSHNVFNPLQWPLRVDILAPDSGRTTVDVYNIVGEKVRHVADWNATRGMPFTYNWDGLNDRGEFVGNGVYVILMRSPESVTHRKVLVLK